jgi:hypothetical protein
LTPSHKSMLRFNIGKLSGLTIKPEQVVSALGRRVGDY